MKAPRGHSQTRREAGMASEKKSGLRAARCQHPRTAWDPGRPVPSVHDEALTVTDHQPTVPPQPPTAPARPQPTAQQVGRGRLGLPETQDFACAARYPSPRSCQNTPPSPADVQRGPAKPRLLPLRMDTPPPAQSAPCGVTEVGKIHCHAPLHARGHAVSYASSPRRRPRSTPPPDVAKVTHAGRQRGAGGATGGSWEAPQGGGVALALGQTWPPPIPTASTVAQGPLSQPLSARVCAPTARGTPPPLRLSRRFFASVFAAAWRAPLHALAATAPVDCLPCADVASTVEGRGGWGGGGGAQM